MQESALKKALLVVSVGVLFIAAGTIQFLGVGGIVVSSATCLGLAILVTSARWRSRDWAPLAYFAIIVLMIAAGHFTTKHAGLLFTLIALVLGALAGVWRSSGKKADLADVTRSRSFLVPCLIVYHGLLLMFTTALPGSFLRWLEHSMPAYFMMGLGIGFGLLLIWWAVSAVAAHFRRQRH